jgi:hypothetical protein
MKLRVVYGTWFVPPGKLAWVLYPFMFFRQPREEVTDTLFRHEWEHVDQVWREGWLKFYCKYIWYWIRYGYKSNPYEIEARHRECDTLTSMQQYWKDGE